MQFFDEKDNWERDEVRVGRAWRIPELRIKSNDDLHKLWFVLLKERNMLMTMEHEYKQKFEPFPSPERLDKVNESMVNLEEVVRERNRAYFELETGETGERPGRLTPNALGMNYWYKASEHVVPPHANGTWWRQKHLWYDRKECAQFLTYYREKLFLAKRKQRIRDRNHVLGLLRRFPDMDMEALKEQYPTVDIERVKRWKKATGHFVPK
ncbi:hypothetical protein AAG570_005241 [Ranatra chinensis]|uniref:Large ribosomal subunit protein uL29m n=1 Tax=Ranatra chinensis TaxID=642074 RepID=A0ABD0XZV9_9HEMI